MSAERIGLRTSVKSSFTFLLVESKKAKKWQNVRRMAPRLGFLKSNFSKRVILPGFVDAEIYFWSGGVLIWMVYSIAVSGVPVSLLPDRCHIIQFSV